MSSEWCACVKGRRIVPKILQIEVFICAHKSDKWRATHSVGCDIGMVEREAKNYENQDYRKDPTKCTYGTEHTLYVGEMLHVRLKCSLTKGVQDEEPTFCPRCHVTIYILNFRYVCQFVLCLSRSVNVYLRRSCSSDCLSLSV